MPCGVLSVPWILLFVLSNRRDIACILAAFLLNVHVHTQRSDEKQIAYLAEWTLSRTAGADGV